MYLGRTVSAGGVRRLGELLLEADNLRVLQTEDFAGVVRICGTVDTGGMVAELEVDIDTSRGFMPIRIRTLDGLMMYPVEVLTVTRIDLVNGHYMPSEGTRETYYLNANEEQAARLDKELSAVGLDVKDRRPDPRDPDTRRKYQEAVRAAFGDAGAPCALIAPPQRMVRVSFPSVNRVIPPEKFVVPGDLGSRLVNLFEGTDDGNPIEDPDAMLDGGE
jgi:hypothetical protein